jgi:hypothetical protein
MERPEQKEAGPEAGFISLLSTTGNLAARPLVERWPAGVAIREL